MTSVLAGEKSGALAEVLDRYITYQKLSLAVRKKVMVSLMYPAVLMVLVICLIVFLVTYVVPNFAELYSSMQAQLPADDADADRGRHHGAQLHPGRVRRRWWSRSLLFRLWAKTDQRRRAHRRLQMRTPCWAKSGSSIRWRSFRAC